MEEKDFALRLAQLRTKKGVSAREMSLAIGQNQGYINQHPYAKYGNNRILQVQKAYNDHKEKHEETLHSYRVPRLQKQYPPHQIHRFPDSMNAKEYQI